MAGAENYGETSADSGDTTTSRVVPGAPRCILRFPWITLSERHSWKVSMHLRRQIATIPGHGRLLLGKPNPPIRRRCDQEVHYVSRLVTSNNM